MGLHGLMTAFIGMCAMAHGGHLRNGFWKCINGSRIFPVIANVVCVCVCGTTGESSIIRIAGKQRILLEKKVKSKKKNTSCMSNSRGTYYPNERVRKEKRRGTK